VIVGDIHWVRLPVANGREQRGRRPAVILQDDQYAGGLPVVLRYGNDSPENGPLMTLA
jgi:mRNA-degrading endonuclease toxin of MazEF toxin-antitoxin module